MGSATVTSGASIDTRRVVFVSYSRQDAKWRDWFVGMLAPVARQRRLEVWTDQREVVGEQWRPQLQDAIRRSRLALLLVSRPFLASEFIMGTEVPALIEHVYAGTVSRTAHRARTLAGEMASRKRLLDPLLALRQRVHR